MIQKYYRYQGRKISKTITQTNLNLLQNFYSLYSYDKEIIQYLESNRNNKKFVIKNTKFNKINIEVGFGDGEYLLKNAINNPQELFIGVEFYKNGIAKVLKNILDFKISNLKLSNINGMYLLSALPNHSVDSLLIINPDPWHKKKHQKRRLISFENLKVFQRIIKSTNSIFITTDSSSYLGHIEKIFKNNREELGDIDIITLSEKDKLYGISRYQRKAIENGKKIYQITI